MINGEEYPARAFELTSDEGYEDLVGFHNLLQSMGHLIHHKPCMIQPGDWGQGNNCTLFNFNNVPSGDADDPKHRNPRQSGNVRYEIDFGANPGTNVTIVIFSEYENVYEINNLGGIQYNIQS